MSGSPVMAMTRWTARSPDCNNLGLVAFDHSGPFRVGQNPNQPEQEKESNNGPKYGPHDDSGLGTAVDCLVIVGNEYDGLLLSFGETMHGVEWL